MSLATFSLPASRNADAAPRDDVTLSNHRRAAAALAFAEPLRDHGGDKRIQAYSFSPSPLHQACMKSLGNSLSPLAASGSERAGRWNRIAKFLERQQTAFQDVAPINDRFSGGFAVRHATGNVGKFDQIPTPPHHR